MASPGRAQTQNSSIPVPKSIYGNTSSGVDGQPPGSSKNEIPSQRAFLLEWDTCRPGTDKSQTYRRTPLTDPNAVHAILAPPQATEETKSGYDGEVSRRLVVLNGLQPAVARALLASGLGIDPAFIESHVARQAYRPARLLKERAFLRRMTHYPSKPTPAAVRYPNGGYVWEYPELVEMPGSHTVAARIPNGELGTVPPVRSLLGKDGKETVVVFYRAGLWLETRGSVLLLDYLRFEGLDQGAHRPRRKRVVLGKTENGPKDKTQTDEENTASLQDLVLDALREGWEPDDQLAGILSEAVYDRWLELFDFLDSQPPTINERTAACYLQMMRSLELNGEEKSDVNWAGLLSRIQRRVDLLSVPRNRPLIAPRATLRTTAAARTPGAPKQRTTTRDVDTIPSIKGRVSRRRQDIRPADENQRALDRLSYIGGILVPLPVISGILSMGDVYGPDGSRFFVFWAAAIPVAVLTVLLIYADTIRKAEVWVEISADRVVPSPGWESGSSSNEYTGPVDVEVKHNRTATWRRHPPSEDDNRPPPLRREDLVFPVDHDAEEQIINMPPAAAAAVHTSDEEVPDWLPASDQWSTGPVWVPRVILERPADSSKPKAWKREKLGWIGAVQTILYKKFREGSDIPVGVAASEKPGRRKAMSYR